MPILKHFDSSAGSVTTFILKDAERNDFLSKLPPLYNASYISKEELEHRITTFSGSKETEWAELIPDEGSIKSGDFGEILAYIIFKERHEDKNVDGPLKWRWKEEKNKPAPYTDVILYAVNDPNHPSSDDILISVESKMKSLKNIHSPIQDAIDGAEKDYVSRIANSLSWLRRKYKEESNKSGAPVDEMIVLVQKINRFINSETTGEYIKKVKAVAFIDQSLFGEEIIKATRIPTIPGLDLSIFAVSIADLKKAYESVLEIVPTL